MKEITLDTKIADLLNDYEGMKDILIDINPKFKKLNNPILRRTVAKVATVKQASIVGGMRPLELLNRLREAVGQPPLDDGADVTIDDGIDIAPEWINGEAKIELDANRILDGGGNPLAVAGKALRELNGGQFLVIESDFKPEPLIDEFIRRGCSVYSQELSGGSFKTYVKVS